MAKLTRLEKNFIKERVKDHKATDKEIAIRAGYSPKAAKQAGYEVKNRPNVEARIKELEGVGLDALEEVARHGKVEIAKVTAGRALVEISRGKPAPINHNQFGDITINVLKLEDKGLLELTPTPVTDPN